MIKFRLSYNSLVAYFPRGKREYAIKAIHDYLIDFFGGSIEYRWKSKGFEAYFTSQNLSLAAAVRLTLDFEDMKLLDLFFSTSPVLKSVNMFSSIGNKQFHPDSKIYQAESIEIDQFFNTVPNVLSRFQGRQAFLETLRYHSSDLIEFVTLWKSGQAFQNLEYLQMRVGCHGIPQNEIFSAIKAKFIAGTKKPLTHTLPKVKRIMAILEFSKGRPLGGDEDCGIHVLDENQLCQIDEWRNPNFLSEDSTSEAPDESASSEQAPPSNADIRPGASMSKAPTEPDSDEQDQEKTMARGYEKFGDMDQGKSHPDEGRLLVQEKERIRLRIKKKRTFKSQIAHLNVIKQCRIEAKHENALVMSRHGAGRTGYFIALAVVVHKLDKATEPRIQEIVKSLRGQRPRAVDSLTQYVSLYTTLFYYIKRKIGRSNGDKKAAMECDEPTCMKTVQLTATFTSALIAEVNAAAGRSTLTVKIK
ncbi:unnamed protein product [Caenorhabditis nigoni]